MADLTTADLLAFSKAISDNDIFTQIAPSLINFKPETFGIVGGDKELGVLPKAYYMSPGAQLASTFGTALLGGLANNYGKQQEAAQKAKLTEILPSLIADPEKIALPEGMDANAFNAIKQTAIVNKASKGNDLNSELAKQLLGVKIAGLKSEEEAMGAIKGKKKAYGNAGLLDPDDPIEKKVADLRNSFDSKEEVQNFKYVSRLSNQLVNTLKNPSAVADPVLAKMVVQFVEPKLAVNAGEAAALGASTSIPDAWKGIIGQAIEGKSKLSPEIRKNLLDIASAAYDAHSKAYNSTYDLFKKEANLFGISPDRISSLGSPGSFNEITNLKEKLSSPIGITEELTAIRDRLKAGVSEEEKSALLKRAKDIELGIYG